MIDNYQTKYDALFNQNLVGMIYTNIQGDFKEVNDKFAHMLGYTKDELINRNFKEITHPEDLNLSDESIMQLEKGLIDTFTIDKRYLHKNGSPIWVRLHVKEIKSKDKDDRTILAIVLDISEQVKCKNRLEKNIQALTTPLENLESIEFQTLFDVNDIQQIQDIFSDSTGVASIITYPCGQPITKPSNFRRVCSDIIRSTEEGFKRCKHSDSYIGKMNQDKANVIECLSCGLWDAGVNISVGGKHLANWLIGQVRDKDVDKERLIEYSKVIGVNEDELIKAYLEVPIMELQQFEKIAKALFIVSQQLSKIAYQNLQQARLIAKLQRIEEDLKKNEDNLSKVQEISRLGVWEIDTETNVITWSEQNYKNFGVKYGEPVDYDRFLSTIHPEDVEYVSNKWNKALQGEDYDIEHRIIIDNHVEWVREKAEVFFDEIGKPLKAIGFTQNISERKLIELELKKYKDSLEEIVHARTHELEEKNKELERYNNLFVGREFRIKELKDKLKELESKLNKN